MNLERRRAAVRRLLVTRLTPSEVLFVLVVIGLIAVVGAVAPSPSTTIYLVSVAWAALVGVMVPRLIEARRDAKALEEAQQKEAKQRVVNHDMASALLTIEGGVQALLHTIDKDDAVANKARAIVMALEVEVRRMRRITASTPSKRTRCWVGDTLDPIIALHRASGAKVDVLLACDVRVAMSADDLVRVVSNVLDNCAKHAPNAPITVSGFLAGHRYHLTIRDQGPGIPEDLREHACEKGVSTRTDGGLGLYSVSKLVESAGGSVQVRSSSTGTDVQIELEALAVSLRDTSAVESMWQWQGEAIA